MSEMHEVKVPPLGESVSEATVARWTKDEGEFVKADEVLVELETDKVTLEVTAPISGVLQAVRASLGTTVHVGEILGTIQLSKGEAPITPKSTPKTESPQQEGSYSPAVLRLLSENKLDPVLIPTSGRDGRLTKEDIMTYLERRTQPESAKKEEKKAEIIPQVEVRSEIKSVVQSADREVRVKISRLRQKVAERLKYAQNTAAILTTFNEVDMTAINTLRGLYKDAYEKKHSIRLGFMSFFVKAAVQALKEIPSVNAEILGDEIIYKNYYDIGVAVSAPQGLVVPVVRNVDMLSFAEVEKQIAEFGKKARDGKLSLEDMSGGTFTVSNGGVFGSLMSTPILNPPQTGILGMHKVQDRPMVVDGKIEIRPMMYIALSYDHRLIDGREAVTFLVRIKENIERPERLLLEI